MNSKIRIKILQKIAQTIPPAPSTEAPAAISAPEFSIPSGTSLAWGSENIQFISKICSTFNNALAVLSQGQISLGTIDQGNINIDPGKFPDATLQSYGKLAKYFTSYFIRPSPGQTYNLELSPNDKAIRVKYMKDFILAFSNLNNTVVNGKIGGDPKTILNSELDKIK